MTTGQLKLAPPMSLWATGGSWSQSLPELCRVSFKDNLRWNPENIWSQQEENFSSLPFTFRQPDSWPSQPFRQPVKESLFLIIDPNFPSISHKMSTFLWSFLVQSHRILTATPSMIPKLDSLEWGCQAIAPGAVKQRQHWMLLFPARP